jgi:RimJ/RimL family protein N-acetyltransferase
MRRSATSESVNSWASDGAMATVPAPILTANLSLSPMTLALLPFFHALVTDEYIRHYLLDGERHSFTWAARQVRNSLVQFDRTGTGLWLASLKHDTAEPIGFCGFIRPFGPGLGNELIYALRKPSARHGLGTEMARAAVERAEALGAFPKIAARVDAVNIASVRIVERLGFVRVGTRPSVFGELRHYALCLQPGTAETWRGMQGSRLRPSI